MTGFYSNVLKQAWSRRGGYGGFFSAITSTGGGGTSSPISTASRNSCVLASCMRTNNASYHTCGAPIRTPGAMIGTAVLRRLASSSLFSSSLSSIGFTSTGFFYTAAASSHSSHFQSISSTSKKNLSIAINNRNNYQRFYSSSTMLRSSNVTSTADSGSNSKYKPNPLDAFRDPIDRRIRMQDPVGRSWSVKELRRKSYDDLHKLWYVLYKEKNMLLTEQQLSRRRQITFPQPERFKKVRKSMGAIRQVLGERKRRAVAAHLDRHEQTMELRKQQRLQEQKKEQE